MKKLILTLTAILAVSMSCSLLSPEENNDSGNDSNLPIVPQTGYSLSSDLSVTGIVGLNWVAAENADYYALEYSLSETGTYFALASSSSTSYSTEFLNPGQTYYVRLHAVNSAGSAEDSPSISVTVPSLPTPSGIDQASYENIQGSWICDTSNAVRFNVGMRIHFRDDFTGIYSFEKENKYREFSAFEIESLDGDSISWAGDYDYSLSADLNTLTLSKTFTNYTETGNPKTDTITTVWSRIDSAHCGAIFDFTTDDNNGLTHEPISYLTGISEGSRLIKTFQAGDNVSSLTPELIVAEGCLISPLPSAISLSSNQIFTITGNGDQWEMSLQAAFHSDEDGNMFINGDFEEDWNGWFMAVVEEADLAGAFEITNGEFHVNVTNPAPYTSWGSRKHWSYSLSHQLVENNIVLDDNSFYQMSFSGRSPDSRDIILQIGEFGVDTNGDGNIWSTYLNSNFSLSPTDSRYAASFQTETNSETGNPSSESMPEIVFRFSQETGEAFIDDVVLTEITEPSTTPAVNMIANGSFNDDDLYWVLAGGPRSVRMNGTDITIENIYTYTDYSVTCYYMFPQSIANGQQYTISFDAISSDILNDYDISIYNVDSGNLFSGTYSGTEIDYVTGDLTLTNQAYSRTFTPSSTYENVYVILNFIMEGESTITIDNIVFKETAP